MSSIFYFLMERNEKDTGLIGFLRQKKTDMRMRIVIYSSYWPIQKFIHSSFPFYMHIYGVDLNQNEIFRKNHKNFHLGT